MAKSKAPKSRAAKRAITPPIDIGNIPRPSSPSQRDKAALLGVRGEAGVTKKKSKKKQLSSKQKARKEAAMEKGAAALEKLEKKKEGSKNKGRSVQARRGNWEDLNENLEEHLETEQAKATIV